MRDVIEMAREVKMPYDFVTGEPINIEKLKAFEELVRSDERERIIAANAPEIKKANAHITAIEQALAAQPATVQEPVATVTSESGNPDVAMSWWHEPPLPVGTKLYTTPPAAQPAPVQEPVAWMTINEYGEEDDIHYENPEGHLLDGWTYKPLYTHPPQAKESSVKLRRGDILRCIETDELCTVWATSTTGKTLVKWSANNFGDYTAEQIGELFWIEPAPVQEPVAQSLKEAVFTVLEGFTISHDVRKILESAYYTTPPAAQRTWVGLTDEEVQKTWDSVMDGAVFTRREVYKAIEAKLRSKNT